jgi:hypothetical protein
MKKQQQQKKEEGDEKSNEEEDHADVKLIHEIWLIRRRR